MPEVGGDGAIYVDPLDVEGMKKKVRVIMNDKDLRVEMIKKGFEQVKKFSWEKCAQETFEVYKRLVKS